ncbi:DUF3034 family protein [Billgrantia montanilacus]|uniref:DUF3034 family protein n=2 Tax=Billgrantia montanilacus TaxID=2282305 RepID=A0A368TRL0_9GAMM|nr:DUF3034 family protein [Halomonas montanilacus]
MIRDALLVIALCLFAGQALAGSRLLATGGVSQIEGAAGGGLSPWGVLAGSASEGELAATAFISTAPLSDYTLTAGGIALNVHDRLELSLAHQHLALDTLGGRLEQQIAGAKLRLFGDLLYHPWGVWSLGVQHKRLDDGSLPRVIGAHDVQGNDIYLSGSKLVFAALAERNLLLNLTLRSTRANQGGLLGFGGDLEPGRTLVAEGSVGLFLTPRWIIGAEYRQKPDNLSFAREDDWRSLYTAYFFSPQLSLTGAVLDLGAIAGLEHQHGGYLSLQFAL